MTQLIKKISPKHSFFILLSLVILISSCKKEEIDLESLSLIEETELITFSLSGILLDDMENPIKDVEITIDNNITHSDDNGFYHFENINAQGPRVKVKYEHPSYFETYKTANVKEGSFVSLNAVLIPLENADEIPASIGGNIISPSGIEISFPADAFIKSDGSSYNGTVKVYTTALHPIAANISDKFPSDFEIINANNEPKLMQLFTGIGVELYSDANEPLQINQTVTVKLPVYTTLLDDAPSTVSLGHFDEEKGFWVEEGSATLNGDHYLAEVNHFSYWCAVVMQDPTNLLGFVFEDLEDPLIGIPVNDLYVSVNLTNTAIAGYTRTLDDGSFSMKVPKDLDLEISFFANSFDRECGEPVYTESIPALSSYLNMGNIIIDAPEMITVTGTVQECNGQNFTSGYVLISNDEGNIVAAYINGDGSFSIPLYSCNDAINIVAYDLDFNFMSETLVIPNTENDIILGNMLACEMVSDPPFLYKVITGGDTLIASNNSGSFLNNFDSDGNITTLVKNWIDVDIQNTSDPTGGSTAMIINISGVEVGNCEAGFFESVIPLNDDVQDGYKVWVHDTPDFESTWMQTYNCIDGAAYLHFKGIGMLTYGNTGEIVTHRDPLADIEIYFPLP